MDFAEEQEMELQALESIYVDELKVEGKDPVVLRLLLKPPSQEEESHVAASLVVSMPPSYPEEMPELQVIAEKNLDPSQIQELMELAEATVG